jgi:hypothetical protein
MSLRQRGSALCALLALAANVGCARPVGTESDSFALRFDWPIGLTAFVETERSTRKAGPQGSSSQTVRMSYRIEVEAAPDGRLIRYGEVRAEDPHSGRSYPLDELPEPMASQFVALLPSYVVNDEGRVVRLVDSDALIDEARRKMRSQLARTLGEEADVEAIVAANVNEENLLELAREHWNRLAGEWSGMNLRLGEIHESEGRLAVDPLGGVEIPAAREFVVGQRLPCDEEMTQAACVEIEIHWRPLPDALARLERAMREASRAARAGTFGMLEDIEIEQSSYLVTEPSTLIPHYLETTTKFRATLPDRGDANGAVEELDQHIYRYRYAPPAGEASLREPHASASRAR